MVPSAALTTATAPTMRHVGSEVVTAVSSTRSGQPIMIVISVSGSATSHHASIPTGYKAIADQTDESKIATAAEVKVAQNQAMLKQKGNCQDSRKAEVVYKRSKSLAIHD